MPKERGTQYYVLKSEEVNAATFQTLLGITEFLQVCSRYSIFWNKKYFLISAKVEEERKAQVQGIF